MFGRVFQASSEETPDQQKNLIKKVRADREHELLLAGSLEAKNAADAITERCSIFYTIVIKTGLDCHTGVYPRSNSTLYNQFWNEPLRVHLYMQGALDCCSHILPSF
ncbi:hypothetical protein AMTRI_Chr09g12880 [Amborella trichopoda]